MALPTLDSVFASAADLPRRQMLAKWLVEELGSGSISDYYDLPERYLWAKIAVAAGAPRGEADYISLPKNYVWSDIYNAVASDSGSHTDWSEKQALGHIAAAYRGDAANPESLATYIDWPWRYQVASIVTYPRIDADALAYIQRVEAADGASLESGVRLAIDNFVRGCKTDGTWEAIKSSAILAGARTLSGALQPLVGAAPTNFNFVSGDYSRTTGLVGDGSTKYLAANYALASALRDNKHLSLFAAVPQLAGNSCAYAGSTAGPDTSTQIVVANTDFNRIITRCSDASSNTSTSVNNVAGLQGVSRSSGASYTRRANNANETVSVSSLAGAEPSMLIFRRPLISGELWTTARISFYSIGESLDLALLDTRVTNLINAYTAAIP